MNSKSSAQLKTSLEKFGNFNAVFHLLSLDDPLLRLKKCIQLHGYDGRRKYFWHAAAILKVFIFIGRTIYAGQTLNQPKKLAELVATYPVRFMAIAKLYVLYIDKKRIEYFYYTINNEFWDYHIAGPKLEAEIKRRFFATNIFVLCHFIGAMSVLTFISLFPIVDMPEGKRPLPNIIWTPFDTDPSPLHEILYVVMLWNLSLSVFGNAFYDVLFIYAMQHLFVQFMLLKELLKNITKEIMDEHEDFDKLSSEYFQKKVYDRLTICVAHHVKLLKFGKNLEIFSSGVLLPQLVMSYAVLVINGYILSIDHSDMMKTTILLNLTGSCLVQLAVFAFQASDIKFQSLSVIDSINNSEWFLFKAPLKKALTFIIMNTKKPISINAGGLSNVDNEVLVQIIQKAFSAITLLRALTAVE
ncbi:odorant receptor 49b-like [Diabrotica virgifera virgifera]|uniref:Odorant receptor n=1 Tax=Diabrotica virgifera virgifera TaxID=50390 RepID=A0ABM5KAP3_DIAVI|nr:odorant receptor 49b-like [Diabrotica virgifera virgifera]